MAFLFRDTIEMTRMQLHRNPLRHSWARSIRKHNFVALAGAVQIYRGKVEKENSTSLRPINYGNSRRWWSWIVECTSLENLLQFLHRDAWDSRVNSFSLHECIRHLIIFFSSTMYIYHLATVEDLTVSKGTRHFRRTWNKLINLSFFGPF